MWLAIDLSAKPALLLVQFLNITIRDCYSIWRAKVFYYNIRKQSSKYIHISIFQNVSSMVMIESKMSSANDMGLDDIKAVDEVLTAPAAASAVAAVQSEQRTPSPARTNSRTKWAGLKSSVSVKSKNGRKKMSNAFPCPMLQSFDLDSPDDSCSNLGLVNRKLNILVVMIFHSL